MNFWGVLNGEIRNLVGLNFLLIFIVGKDVCVNKNLVNFGIVVL